MPFLKDKYKFQSNGKQIINLIQKNKFRHSIYTTSGNKYIGDWRDNLKNGKGAFLTTTYKLYEGCWKNNFKHGSGALCWRDKKKVFILKYTGEWENGLECGFGARHYLDGAYYLGYFKNGKRHGYGQMWYSNGAYYDGDWAKDLRHGLGMLIRDDGNRYEGGWSFNLKNGNGRFFHLRTGQMQDGIWENGICVTSCIVDIPYRNVAFYPTPYPIQVVKLLHMNKVCYDQRCKIFTDDQAKYNMQESKEI